MSADKDNVVFLAFSNKEVVRESALDVLSCKACKNKTFTVRCDLGEWPVMQCACCQQQIGKFGWAERA